MAKAFVSGTIRLESQFLKLLPLADRVHQMTLASGEKPLPWTDLRKTKIEKTSTGTVVRGVGRGIGAGMVLSAGLGFAASDKRPVPIMDQRPAVKAQMRASDAQLVRFDLTGLVWRGINTV